MYTHTPYTLTVLPCLIYLTLSQEEDSGQEDEDDEDEDDEEEGQFQSSLFHINFGKPSLSLLRYVFVFRMMAVSIQKVNKVLYNWFSVILLHLLASNSGLANSDHTQ